MLKVQHIFRLMISLFIITSTFACTGSVKTEINPSNLAEVTPSNTPVSSVSNEQPTTDTATPANPGQINILDISSFKDESDYWYFYGLVRNDTDHAVNDLQIEVKLLDSAGAEIYSYIAHSMLTYLEPGEISPFSDFTTEPYQNGASMQATVIGSQNVESISRVSLDYRGITMWIDENNVVYLAGEVLNSSPGPVEINGIAGSLLDASGKMITTSSAYPFLGYVEANSSSPFVMMFDAPSGQAGSLTHYSLYSDAIMTNPAHTKDISISKQSRYQDTNGNTHLVGTVTNNTDQPLNIFLLAGLYDKDGNCIDANSIYLPFPMNPGATFPYDFTLWGAVDYVLSAYDAVTDERIFIDWMSTFPASSQTMTLTTRDDTHAYDGTAYLFTGTLTNTSGQDLTYAFVSVSLYDKSTGELIATNITYVGEALAIDSSGPYQMYAYPPNDLNPENVRIEISAFGQ